MTYYQSNIGIDAMVCEGPSGFVPPEVMIEDLHIDPAILEKHGVKGFTWPTLSEGNATMYANGFYKLGKFLVRQDNIENLNENPIMFNIHSSETNARKVPDSLDGTLFATSKLLAEDENKYTPLAEQIYSALPIPITWNCAGFGIGLQVAVLMIMGYKTATGKGSSALVSATEVSVYDETLSGYLTTISQGGYHVIARVTFNPQIAEADPTSFSSFIFPETGFSKFIDQHIPFVVSKISHMAYSYTPAQAMRIGEQRSGYTDSYGNYSAVIHHTPIRSERDDDSKAAFVSDTRRQGGEAWERLKNRIGDPPDTGVDGFTQLFDSKLYKFNRGDSPKMTQKETINSIQNDPDIRAYWKWSQSLDNYQEFDAFLQKIHHKESVEEADGNSYSATPAKGLARVVRTVDIPAGSEVLFVTFGSESAATIARLALTNDTKTSRERVLFRRGGEIPLNLPQYRYTHSRLLTPEGKRTVTNDNLIEEDFKLLQRSTLPDGFHYINRDKDTTTRMAFIENGMPKEVYPIYVAPSLKSRLKA